MSIRYEIPGRSTAGNLPILGFNESELVHGSLMYLEPARQKLSAVPTVGEALTNYAKGSFSSLTGGSLSDADAVVTLDQIYQHSKRELTSAGALHGFFNNAEPSNTIGSYRIALPQALIDYIHANNGNTFYLDAVIRGTQEPVYISSPVGTDWMVGISTGGSGGETLFGIRNLGDTDLPDTNNHLIYPASSWTGVELSRRDLWMQGPAMAQTMRSGNPVDFDSSAKGEVNWQGPSAPGSVLQGGQSYIFYSLYIEDCTVSGRTLTEIRAWRDSQFSSDFGPGGRYSNEVWTDPVTYSW